MSVWILIMYMSGVNNGGPITIEHKTMEGCNHSRLMIIKHFPRRISERGFCLQVIKP